MILQCRIDSFTFPGSKRPLLRDLDLELDQGSFTLIRGSSGNGKSTLCRVLCGVYPQIYEAEIEGEIRIAGNDISQLNLAKIGTLAGIVFQDPDHQLLMPSGEHEIAFGLESMNLEPDEIRWRISFWAQRLNISHLLPVNPRKCSGGEKQAIVLASVLAMDRPLLIMDEPTAQLDSERSQLLHKILAEQKSSGKSILLISHDKNFFHLADRQLLLQNGCLYQQSGQTA